MNTDNKNGNGGAKSAAAFKGEKIEFPVTFQLKAVMIGTENDEKHKERLAEVFNKLNIPYKYLDKRFSSKGAYVSFTYEVTLVDKVQMDKLYVDLKAVKELKFAV